VGGLVDCIDMEGIRRMEKGIDIGDITANLGSDNCSFHFLIQEGHNLCYVPFRKLFSLRVNDPSSSYIAWESPKNFRGKNFTIVANFLPHGS